MADEQQPSFWTSFKNALHWFATHLLGPILAVVLIAGALILVFLGFKKLQIGGLLAALLGKGSGAAQAIATANSVPPSRVDAKGNLIPIGQPDTKGDAQVQVVPIDSPGLFSNPKTVTYTAPGDSKSTTLALPDGVTNNDVHQVLIVSPEVTMVTVKDSSGLPAEDVDNLIKKYQ